MKFDYSLIAFYVSGILVILVSGVIVYLIRQIREAYDGVEKLFEERYPELYLVFRKIVDSGVLESELEWLKGFVEEKEEFAIAVIQEKLNLYGLGEYFDLKDIVREIKLSVYEQFNKQRENYTPK